MVQIQLIACIGMIVGLFIVFQISPMAFTGDVFEHFTNQPKTIRDDVDQVTHRKKQSFFRREIAQVQDILLMTGRSAQFPILCAVALACFALGTCIAIMLSNFFLVPVLAIGCMFLPFWYVKLMASHFKRDISAELETALSIITTAYLRTEDILMAVEENITYLNPPVLSVFQAFVSQVRLINPDVVEALYTLKGRIENPVFREWCDAIIACQGDRHLKTTLTPIVSKLSDMRVVNGELENLIFEPRKEFVMMQVLVLGNIPLLYFLNQDWYNVLMHTPLGQLILALCGAVMFISTAFVIHLTQPIEYRR